MNPVRRLTFAGAGVIAGAAIAAAGTRLAWATATLSASPVAVKGFPKVVLAGGGLRLDASSVGAGYLFGLALLLALIPLGWLVGGPRVRVALGLIAVAIAAGIMLGTAAARGDVLGRARATAVATLSFPGTTVHVASGPGIVVTAAGAAFAAVAAVAGAAAGGRTPRLGLPERPDRGRTP